MLLSIVASLILWLPFAQNAAQQVHPPACGPVVITYTVFANPNTAGRASWGAPGVCLIEIDEDRQWDFPLFCRVVVHEYGHLYRQNGTHDNDPSNIMHHTVTPNTPSPECDAQAQLLQQQSQPLEPPNQGITVTTDPGRNTIRAGSGDDIVKVKEGKGLIDCGRGYDVVYTTRKVKKRFRFLRCERYKFV